MPACHVWLIEFMYLISENSLALQLNQVLYVIVYEMSTAVITDVSVYETNIYKKINLNIKLIQLISYRICSQWK